MLKAVNAIGDVLKAPFGDVGVGPIPTSPDFPILWREKAEPSVFEEARVGRVFNARRPSRQPLAVVKATSQAHIVEAVQIANKLNVRVSIRSGGHSWAGWSVRDNAILIDLGDLKEIDLDEEKGIVKVSPSTTGRMLNGFLNEKGLMFAGGHCPDVGLGGFLLQGGMGWNCRNWGWAAEKVIAIDVVTAKGESLHCDTEQNSELLWMARGSGPGFAAIVTRFYLEIRPKFTNCLSSTFIYPVSMYKTVMDWIIKTTPLSDESTEIVAVGMTPPGIDQLCTMAHIVTFQNSQVDAEKSLSLFNSTHPAGAIVENINCPTSLAKEYQDQAAANPLGHRYACDNAYIKNDADVTAVLEEAFTTLPHKKAFSLWYAMAPTSRRQMQDMALSMHSDHYFALYTVWEHEFDDDRCSGWVRDVMKSVERQSTGAYLGDSDFQIRRTKFWGEKEGKRLMELREKWDPEGRICGYLDKDDVSGVKGLKNEDEWILADH